jgi:hypothetical protein
LFGDNFNLYGVPNYIWTLSIWSQNWKNICDKNIYKILKIGHRSFIIPLKKSKRRIALCIADTEIVAIVFNPSSHGGRVTRLGEISPFWGLFTLGNF